MSLTEMEVDDSLAEVPESSLVGSNNSILQEGKTSILQFLTHLNLGSLK
jgi:hypothetical protein